MTMSLVAIFCQDRKDINLVPRHINTRSVSFSPEAYICQEVLYVSCDCITLNVPSMSLSNVPGISE